MRNNNPEFNQLEVSLPPKEDVVVVLGMVSTIMNNYFKKVKMVMKNNRIEFKPPRLVLGEVKKFYMKASKVMMSSKKE